MSKDEFDKAKLPGKEGLYSLVRRDSKGTLILIPYHEAYADQLQQAADLLNQASALASDPGLKKYLALRAQSLLTDQYRESDLAWLDMKDNDVDLIIGPIETYEDALFGYKASYECFVLLKDMDWSARLARYAHYLPQLQKDLPVPVRYKQEKPGTDSDLGAYNAVYYAGDANAGAKTIADNLPNDEQVQLEKGTRRLQMENVIHAKFDKIMLPIANELIAPEQLKHVTFDASSRTPCSMRWPTAWASSPPSTTRARCAWLCGLRLELRRRQSRRAGAVSWSNGWRITESWTKTSSWTTT